MNVFYMKCKFYIKYELMVFLRYIYVLRRWCMLKWNNVVIVCVYVLE